MKKASLTIGMFLIGCVLFAQTPMPEKMAKSILILRPGILDMENTTVEEFFLNKEFIKTEQLDGTITTARYGKARLDGNSYALPIEIVNSEKIQATITYLLVFQGETTLLETVSVKNLKTMESEESSDFSVKFQVLLVFNNLLLKTHSEESKND